MNNNSIKSKRGPIAWMAHNRVAANLLMFIILIGGFFSAKRLKQEVFPEFDMDIIQISCPYPGASPTDVEQGILFVIEEAVRGVDGVKRITSKAIEGLGTTTLELHLSANPNVVMNDVKNQVDRITTFPEDIESPAVSLAKAKIPVVSLIISGDEEHNTLHGLAEKIRTELLRLPQISQVELGGIKPLEISIEVTRENLESYGLTLDQIARQVRSFSLELPGGSVESKSGTFLIRLSDRRLSGEDFKSIVVKGAQGAQEVRLGDIATIHDGYAETDLAFTFNNESAVMVTAYRVGRETPTSVANALHGYLQNAQKLLPTTISVTVWDDNSVMLKERMQLLLNNALLGLTLVIIILTIFLQKRLAFWVAVGVPISFLGAFLIMGPMGASINMITLFALIIVLGMVVDDAIVVAENVYQKIQAGQPPLTAAITGTQEMIVPVTFSILTTIAAFSPLLAVPGVMGKVFYLIPVVVILVLSFSWLESFLILPAHLAHEGKKNWLAKIFAWIDVIQEHANAWLYTWVQQTYAPFLKITLKNRFIALSCSCAVFIIVVGMVPAGILKFTFFPRVETDIVSATLRLPFGVPLQRTNDIAFILHNAAKECLEELSLSNNAKGIFARIGQLNSGMGPRMNSESGSHLLSMDIDLGPSSGRNIGSQEFAHLWKSKLPPIAGVESFAIGSAGGPHAGKAVDLLLYHADISVLGQASRWIAAELSNFTDLTDIENSFSTGKPQLDFSLKPGAYALGISSNDVGRALRTSFYGAEALREQRGRNELKVMVRLNAAQRYGEYGIEKLLVASPNGGYVPLSSVAMMKRSFAPTEINRENGQRKVSISAELLSGKTSSNQIIRDLKERIIPEMYAKFPGIKYDFGGQQREMAETFDALGPNFLLALLVIFTLLAIPFKSYGQPLIVMAAIPFGVVGAFVGHAILGYDLSLMSFLGIIALSGVVVNDSLVFVDTVNRFRKQGMSVPNSLVNAGICRFRPILLTSLTTFFGLLPLIFETSMQAKFLIPMAISLGFGILFTTVITLLLVPILYLIFERVRLQFGFASKEELEW